MSSKSRDPERAAVAHPLEVIAEPPPSFATAAVLDLVRDAWGIDADAEPLVSERDQNFRLRAADGRSYVLKIANAAEDPAVADLQIRALLHIERRADPLLRVPRVIPTLSGDTSTTLSAAGRRHAVRLVSWVDGTPLGARAPDTALCRSMGRFLARLGSALADFDHPAAGHSLLWDMQRAADLRPLLDDVRDPDDRARIAATLDEFEQTGLPAFDGLRRQVIHNDMNPDNVLVADDGATVGIIDFGDMLQAPLIVDVAVAAAYLRDTGGRPLRLVEPFVAGYHAERPLAEDEIELLPLLVRTRLAATVTILEWRAARRGDDDPYLLFAAGSESNAATFLASLADLDAGTAAASLARATGG